MLNVDGLLGGVLEHEPCRRFHLDDFIPTGVQIVQVDDTIFVGVVVAVGQLLVGAILVLILGNPDFKFSAFDSVPDDTIYFIDGETGLFLVLYGDLSGLTGPQVDFMGGGIKDVPRWGLFFRDDVISFGEVLLRHGDRAVRAHREVTDLHASLGLDLKNSAGQMLALNVHFHDLQGGPLVVLELHLGFLVGKQGHRLGRSIQNVIFRNALLGDGIDSGQEVGDNHLAIRPRGLGGDGGAVRAPQSKGHTGYRVRTVLVPFADDQTGPLIILQMDLSGFTWGQLHMVLGGIQDVIGQGGGFLH